MCVCSHTWCEQTHTRVLILDVKNWRKTFFYTVFPMFFMSKLCATKQRQRKRQRLRVHFFAWLYPFTYIPRYIHQKNQRKVIFWGTQFMTLSGATVIVISESVSYEVFDETWLLRFLTPIFCYFHFDSSKFFNCSSLLKIFIFKNIFKINNYFEILY